MLSPCLQEKGTKRPEPSDRFKDWTLALLLSCMYSKTSNNESLNFAFLIMHHLGLDLLVWFFGHNKIGGITGIAAGFLRTMKRADHFDGLPFYC